MHHHHHQSPHPGLDYWAHVDIVVHDDWQSFRRVHSSASSVGVTERDATTAGSGTTSALGEGNYFFTRDARQSIVHTVFEFDRPVFLFFGAETFGFAPEVSLT
jgi:tRNA(Leu) C34 or U34 (ribose-2'-O)-methylase TrmL